MRLINVAATVKQPVFLSYKKRSIRDAIRLFTTDKDADVEHLIETSLVCNPREYNNNKPALANNCRCLVGQDLSSSHC
jgi:hypothetical protein